MSIVISKFNMVNPTPIIDLKPKSLRSPKDIIIEDKTLHDIIYEHQVSVANSTKFPEKLKLDKNIDLSHVDFSGYNLSYINFTDINLEGSKFKETRLVYADLINTNLEFATFEDTVLSYANLCNSNLNYTNLNNVILYNAKLSHSTLKSSRLKFTNLHEAIMDCCDFEGSYFFSSDLAASILCDAIFLDCRNLDSCNLLNADLRGVKNMPYIPSICPEEGSFIGWKIAEYNKPDNPYIIPKLVKLEIPEDAKRSSATSRKCRCNKAKVLAIYEFDGRESDLKEVVSIYDKNFIYKVGETIEVEDFDEDRWNECSAGIHFFMNRQEAIDYY